MEIEWILAENAKVPRVWWLSRHTESVLGQKISRVAEHYAKNEHSEPEHCVSPLGLKISSGSKQYAMQGMSTVSGDTLPVFG